MNVLSILTSALLLVSHPVMPQEADANCGPHADVIRELKDRWGELRQNVMLSSGGTAIWETYAAPHSGTWTLVVTGPDGIACVAGSGTDYQPTFEGPTF